MPGRYLSSSFDKELPVRLWTVAVLVGLMLVGRPGPMAAPAPVARQAKPVTLQKAGMLLEVTNSQKRVIVPSAGQAFLWVTAKGATVQTIDLTKVALTNDASSTTLLGVDGQFDGDPHRFAMIGAATLKTGGPSAPLEESWSVGSIAFAFTPGNAATLTISQPPHSFCLLFSVPRALQSGHIKGLGSADLSLPTIASR